MKGCLQPSCSGERLASLVLHSRGLPASCHQFVTTLHFTEGIGVNRGGIRPPLPESGRAASPGARPTWLRARRAKGSFGHSSSTFEFGSCTADLCGRGRWRPSAGQKTGLLPHETKFGFESGMKTASKREVQPPSQRRS